MMNTQHSQMKSNQQTQPMAMPARRTTERSAQGHATRPTQAASQPNALSPTVVVSVTTTAEESAFYFCYW
jgi:hypothetical protein